MSDSTPPPPPPQQPPQQPPVDGVPPYQPAQQPPVGGVPPYPLYADMAAQAGLTPQPYGGPQHNGPVGQVRGTGFAIGISIVTLGIYAWYWFYQTHTEMKAHTGQGIGGGLALVLAIFVGFVNPFLSSSEVGGLYSRRGEAPPVSGLTGLWYIPGIIILVGPIVWFVKTNRALNDYWRSVGASG